MHLLQTADEDIFIWSLGQKCSVNPPHLTALEILLFAYLLTAFLNITAMLLNQSVVDHCEDMYGIVLVNFSGATR